MTFYRRCILRCLNNSHNAIVLPNNEEVVIGRGPNTKINDKKCSRKQVVLIADTDVAEVKVRQLGPNSSGVNGMALKQNETYTLKHGDRLEVLFAQYIHRIEFDPEPGIKNEENGIKRKADEMYTTNAKKSKDGNVCSISGSSQHSENVWERVDNGKLLIYTAKNVSGRTKIAAYDVDGTIITTQSGRVFPKDCNDWKIAFNEVPGKLKQLYGDGYKIVFMTNQAGIGRKVSEADFKDKIVKIVNKLSVPIQVFISTGKGFYRKPAPGMWNTLVEQRNDGIPVDVGKSFYCGDAAGREANWAPKKKKDFSSSDRLMALNLGLKFYTPEEHFLQQRPAAFKPPEFTPSALDCNVPLLEPSDAQLTSDTKEVVILVGSPGSGKSFFASTHLVPKGYCHVNRDTLGSWQKCVSVMESALGAGKSVVVDNTNPDKESRFRFIDTARKHGVPCRCFVLKTSMQHARHNNKFREMVDDTHEPVSEMVINMYKSKYAEPSLDEGFSAVVQVNFIPKFTDPQLQKLYKMYLLER